MGQFSWYTQDDHQQIRVDSDTRQTVYLYDNQGNVWREDNYKGYGIFGGKDYYELLAEMNGLTTRDEGIELEAEWELHPELERLTFPDQLDLSSTENLLAQLEQVSQQLAKIPKKRAFIKKVNYLSPNLTSSPAWEWRNIEPQRDPEQGEWRNDTK